MQTIIYIRRASVAAGSTRSQDETIGRIGWISGPSWGDRFINPGEDFTPEPAAAGVPSPAARPNNALSVRLKPDATYHRKSGSSRTPRTVRLKPDTTYYTPDATNEPRIHPSQTKGRRGNRSLGGR